MKKNLYIASTVFALAFTANAMDENSYQKAQVTSKTTQTTPKNLNQNKTNFSGDWLGHCDNDPQNEYSLHIDQSYFKLSLTFPSSYDTRLDFFIDGLRNTHESFREAEEVSSYHASWENDSKLTLTYYVATSALGSNRSMLRSQLRKITLSSEADALLLDEEYFRISFFGNTDHGNLSCLFHKK